MNTNKYPTLEYVDYTKNPQMKDDFLPPAWLDQFLVFCSKTNIEGYEQYIALVSVPSFYKAEFDNWCKQENCEQHPIKAEDCPESYAFSPLDTTNEILIFHHNSNYYVVNYSEDVFGPNMAMPPLKEDIGNKFVALYNTPTGFCVHSTEYTKAFFDNQRDAEDDYNHKYRVISEQEVAV